MLDIIVRRETACPFLAADGAGKPATSGVEVAARHLNGYRGLFACHDRSRVIPAAMRQQPTQPAFQAHDSGKHAELPARPMSRGIGQQRVPYHQAKHGRYAPAMQRLMMHRTQVRLIPDLPAVSAGAATQVHVLVVQKKIPVQPFDSVEAVLANEQAATAHPIDLPPPPASDNLAAPLRARPDEAKQAAQQRGEAARRRL